MSLFNDANELEIAMCILLPNDSSDEELYEGNEEVLMLCSFNKTLELWHFQYRRRNICVKPIYST